MDYSPLILIVAVLGGFLAGIVNTLAGNGSAITLSIMTELMGIPSNIANGTNRVGVLMQSVSSSYSFIKNKRLDVRSTRTLIITAVVGAILGVITAINVSNEQFDTVFQYLLVIMLIVLLINPKRWLKNSIGEEDLKHPLALPLFFFLGFYGGFIQMGMGIVFLMVTVLLLKYNLITANALKTGVVAIYTIIAVILFEVNGLIDWRIGLTIGLGQALGGYITAEFASKYKQAQLWAYILLIAVVVIAILSTFGILAFTL